MYCSFQGLGASAAVLLHPNPTVKCLLTFANSTEQVPHDKCNTMWQLHPFAIPFILQWPSVKLGNNLSYTAQPPNAANASHVGRCRPAMRASLTYSLVGCCGVLVMPSKTLLHHYTSLQPCYTRALHLVLWPGVEPPCMPTRSPGGLSAVPARAFPVTSCRQR